MDGIGEHGVAETGKRLRLALAEGFLRGAECSLKEGLGGCKSLPAVGLVDLFVLTVVALPLSPASSCRDTSSRENSDSGAPTRPTPQNET